MNIIEMNEGQKIPYTINDNIINFDNKYSINCQEKQEDIEKRINLFSDKENISENMKDGQYIANIIIPPKRYIYDQSFELQEENFDINSVILQLWSI